MRTVGLLFTLFTCLLPPQLRFLPNGRERERERERERTHKDIEHKGINPPKEGDS